MTAAAKDLITIARAKQNISVITDATYDTTLQTLVTAASDAIEKYCRRNFYAKAFDELYNGNGNSRLILRQYPVQSVQSVRYRPVTVLNLTNTLTSTNQQARVQVTSTGLTLTRVHSGSSDSDVVGFGAYPTLATLAAYINTNLAVYGWSATVVGDSNDYGKWPSADLYIPPSYGDGITSQGNLTARGQNAELKMHTYELAGYQFDPRGWLLRAIPYTDPELIHPEDLVFPAGINNFRVQYTAGYTTIPEAVQEACAEWVSAMWYSVSRDPSISNIVSSSTTSTLSTSTATSYVVTNNPAIPPNVRALLAPYRRYNISNGQG